MKKLREVRLEGLLEMAWVIIANAGGGDWGKELPDWRAAAERWRDDYHREVPGAP